MKILEKQGYHILILALLLLGVRFVIGKDDLAGSFLGFSSRGWFWLSILIPVLHQVYVVVLWRAELYYKLMTKWFGNQGFVLWAVGFFILFLARPVLITSLAIANQGTLTIPVWLGLSLGILCLPPVIYLGYSVGKYFGINRALGMDHFQPREYRDKPFVKQGIFRWTPNPMYIFGFLLFWIPGLILFSRAAMVSALFSHLYIWVHYFFTEYPDMQYIYESEQFSSRKSF